MIRALIAAFRGLPALPWLLAARVDRWMMRLHRPQNVGTAEQPIAVCLMHGRRAMAWPCKDWTEADERALRNSESAGHHLRRISA
jgi:hypothetical protein